MFLAGIDEYRFCTGGDIMQKIALIAASLAVLAGPVLAEDAKTTGKAPAEAKFSTVSKDEMFSSKLKVLNVYNQKDEQRARSILRGSPNRLAPQDDDFAQSRTYAALRSSARLASWRRISVVPVKRSSGVSHSWKNTTFMSGRTLAAWPCWRMK